MEEDFNPPSTSILPMALAVLSLVVGGAGLYFGLNANQALRALEESVDSKQSNVAESAQEIANLKDKVKTLAASNKDLESAVSRLRAYGNERDKRLKNLTLELSKQEDRLVDNTKTVSGSAVEGNATSVAVTAGNYTIQSGDTFSSIASKSGVKLQALLDVNPGVDPRRLRVGQVITIPGN